MYSIIAIWVIGVLFTYGINMKTLEDLNAPLRTKIRFALSIHLWLGWPILLGDGIRRLLDKD